MKEILANLALIDLVKFCKNNNLDCSGTHLTKQPKPWTYALVRDKDYHIIATVKFSKTATPTHTITDY